MVFCDSEIQICIDIRQVKSPMFLGKIAIRKNCSDKDKSDRGGMFTVGRKPSLSIKKVIFLSSVCSNNLVRL